jgi:hypothetical protein
MIRILPINKEPLLVHTVRLNFHNTDFEPFMAYLKKNLDNLRKHNDTAENASLLHGQGACQVLSQLIEQIEGSREVLDKVRGGA